MDVSSRKTHNFHSKFNKWHLKVSTYKKWVSHLFETNSISPPGVEEVHGTVTLDFRHVHQLPLSHGGKGDTGLALSDVTAQHERRVLHCGCHTAKYFGGDLGRVCMGVGVRLKETDIGWDLFVSAMCFCVLKRVGKSLAWMSYRIGKKIKAEHKSQKMKRSFELIFRKVLLWAIRMRIVVYQF